MLCLRPWGWLGRQENWYMGRGRGVTSPLSLGRPQGLCFPTWVTAESSVNAHGLGLFLWRAGREVGIPVVDEAQSPLVWSH